MVVEREQEWSYWRKKLIIEINDASNRIAAYFGEISVKLSEKIEDANFYANDLSSILDDAQKLFEDAAGNTSSEASKIIDAGSAFATKAARDTDLGVFKMSLTAKLGGGAPSVAARLKRKRYSTGFKVSDKLWPSDKKILGKFYKTVEDGIKGGREVGKVVEDLVSLKTKYAPEKLPKYLSRLESAANKAAQGLPGAKKEFDKLTASVRRQLARRKVAEYVRPSQKSLGIFGTRQSTKAFVDRLDKAVNKGSKALVKEAIDKHLVKRAQYNSTRAVRTMAGRAFMEQGQAERKKRKWVIGEKWTLSGSHPRLDECDIRAEMDFGMGPGVFKPGTAPYDHVNGLCYLVDVIDENYFEDAAEKPKKTWKQNYKNLVKNVDSDSKLSKYANKLGRQQNKERVAEEMAKAGPHFAKTATKTSYPKYSIDELNTMMKLEESATAESVKPLVKKTLLQKKPSVTTKQSAAKGKLSAIDKNNIYVDEAAEARKVIPFSAIKEERAKIADEVYEDLKKAQAANLEAKKKAEAAKKAYFKEKERERLFGKTLKEMQEKRTATALKTYNDLLEEAAERKAKKDALEKAHEAFTPTPKPKKAPGDLDVLDFQGARQIGPQAGSNPGGLYEINGEKFYVKWPQTADHARNEALASAFYRRAGIKSPEIYLIKDGDQVGVASKIIDGLTKNAAKLREGKLYSLHDGFGMDAWLANWDVVGLDWDNLLIKGRTAYRLDTGGALLYRAQGAAKGAAFGNVVEEWRTFRTVQGYTTTPVFENITEKKLIAAGKRVLKISDDEIKAYVRLYGMPDSLAETLIARKKYIKAQVSALEKAAKARRVAPARIPANALTKEELKLIEDARGNGYAVAIDKRDVEDQQILFWREKRPDRKWIMNAQFKIREDAMRKIEHIINQQRAGIQTTGPKFVAKPATYDVKKIRKGHMTQTGEPIFQYAGFGDVYEAKLGDGTIIRYWMDDRTFTEKGKMQIISAADGENGASAILKAMDELGISSARATALDAEELYLTQIAYHAGPREFAQFQRYQRLPEQGPRVEAMREYVSQGIGVNDITMLPDYKPGGRYEPFGHGRILRERPDMTGGDWDDFFDEHSLYHDICYGNPKPEHETIDAILNSGGKFVSLQERLRRGVKLEGTSVDMDMQSGGGSYFFTRIFKKNAGENGIYWKSTNLRRLDSISYAHDEFGRTAGDAVTRMRQTGVSQLRGAAARYRNETLFKDGLSIFDDLDKIVVETESEKRKVIQVFKKHGYDNLPDGRKIEDIIYRSDEINP